MQSHSEVLEVKASEYKFWGNTVQLIIVGILIRRGEETQTQREENHVKTEAETE